jgi:hypothetical protein
MPVSTSALAQAFFAAFSLAAVPEPFARPPAACAADTEKNMTKTRETKGLFISITCDRMVRIGNLDGISSTLRPGRTSPIPWGRGTSRRTSGASVVPDSALVRDKRCSAAFLVGELWRALLEGRRELLGLLVPLKPRLGIDRPLQYQNRIPQSRMLGTLGHVRQKMTSCNWMKSRGFRAK